MNSSAPETTIVIRAFNEERWLPEVFAALHRQRYRDFEVLLVDSGSLDTTRDIAADNGARIVRLRSEDFTFGYSLNLGVAEARGSLIAILSAHAIPSDEFWLERLVAPLREPEVAMVYGGQRGHKISKFSECRDFERTFPATPHRVDAEVPFANNANSAIRKDLWQIHRFDEGLPGLEDIEWAKHWLDAGKQVQYEPDGCIIHVHTESWAQVRRRYHREAMAARWVGLKILRHIPGEVVREIAWCAHDLWQAAAAGKLGALAPEVFRFRYEKLVGTVAGITDSRGLDSPGRRAEMYFRKGFPALVVKGPNRVELEDRSVPSLKPGEILVRVSHVGLSDRDWEIIEGKSERHGGSTPYPIVLGEESSGTVAALGPRVTELNEGDRVVVYSTLGCGECNECQRDRMMHCQQARAQGRIRHDGACAAYLVTRARYVLRVPDGLSLAKAALAQPLAIVHKGLRRLGQHAQGMPCAVIGAGTLGYLAAQVLALRGYKVSVFDSNAERLRALNPTIATSSKLDALDEFELIIETTGHHETLTALLEQSSPGSSLLLLNQTYREHRFDVDALVTRDRCILGSVGSTRQDFAEALTLLPSLDTDALLQVRYPLEEFEKALDLSRTTLKVMLMADSSTA
jgi:D-arabinose 1-dehydrogenase-like Zn-dependent alcohol dehydrogenase/GT2 family glycosyltransferase